MLKTGGVAGAPKKSYISAMILRVIATSLLFLVATPIPAQSAGKSASYKIGYNYIMETQRDRLTGLNDVFGVNGQPVLRKVKKWCSFVPIYRWGGPKNEKDWSKGCVDATMTLRQYE